MDKWAKNIRKFYLFKLFTIFNMVNPILIFYMLDKGMTMGDILLLSALQRIFGTIIEVPTGVLSDTKGHKYNLMLGTISFSISCIWFIFSNTFLHFLIAEIFMAMAGAFISGADTSFVYESLEMCNAENTYEKVYGKMRSLQFGCTAILFFAAGFLAELRLELPFLIAAVFAFVAFLISSTLVEPRKEKILEVSGNKERYQEYYLTLKNACKIAIKNVEIRWFLLFTALLSVGIITVEDYYQPFIKDDLHLPVFYLGIIYSLLYLCSAFFSNYTATGLKKLGYERMFYLLPALPIITGLGMVFFKEEMIIILFFLPFIARGFIPTLVSGYLNRRTNPGQRATILSLRHLIRKLAYILLVTFIGKSNDFWGMNTAILITVGILFVAMVLPFLYKIIYNLNYEDANVQQTGTIAK